MAESGNITLDVFVDFINLLKESPLITGAFSIVSILFGAIFVRYTKPIEYFFKPRWKCYRCRKLPTNQIFSEEYDPNLFTFNPVTVTETQRRIDEWYKDSNRRPLLIRGKSGIGKSRVVVQYIHDLPWHRRWTTRVLMPTVEELKKDFPILPFRYILFFDDIYKYSGKDLESTLEDLLKRKGCPIVATVPDKMYDENWEVYRDTRWDIHSVDDWSEDDGIETAKLYGKEFVPEQFLGTPMSVILPKQQLCREYERVQPKFQRVLVALLDVKHFLNTEAERTLLSSMIGEEVSRFELSELCHELSWIKRYEDFVILPDWAFECFQDYEAMNWKPDHGRLFDHLSTDEDIQGRERYMFYLGNWNYDNGHFTDAFYCMDKVVEFKPGKHEAWNNRGVLLDELDRCEDAVASYDRALEFKPDKYEAWYNRGNSLAKMERDEDAVASYDKALEFKPDFYEAWNNRGILLGKMERDEDAVASYDRALEIMPDYHETWYNRGYSLIKLGRYEDALDSVENALSLLPDYDAANKLKKIIKQLQKESEKTIQ